MNDSGGKMKYSKTKKQVLLAMFIAIEILLSMIPFLGFIPIGPLRLTTLHIPVIAAGIVLGKKEGSLIGLTFGLMSLFINTIQPTITSFVFSPFISGTVLSLFISIVPRVLIGYISGLLFEHLCKYNLIISIIISSLAGALTNTILVLGGILIIFGDLYAKILHKTTAELFPYFISIIFSNGLLEAVVGTIIVFMVSKVLFKVYQKEESPYV